MVRRVFIPLYGGYRLGVAVGADAEFVGGLDRSERILAEAVTLLALLLADTFQKHTAQQDGVAIARSGGRVDDQPVMRGRRRRRAGKRARGLFIRFLPFRKWLGA